MDSLSENGPKWHPGTLGTEAQAVPCAQPSRLLGGGGSGWTAHRPSSPLPCPGASGQGQLASTPLPLVRRAPSPPWRRAWIPRPPPPRRPRSSRLVIHLAAVQKACLPPQPRATDLLKKPQRQRRPVGGDCPIDYFSSWVCFVFFFPLKEKAWLERGVGWRVAAVFKNTVFERETKAV